MNDKIKDYVAAVFKKIKRNPGKAGFSVCVPALLGVSALLLAGCGGPSDEKIAEAQQKYAELAGLHNDVVDAHGEVEDGSLDESLSSLSSKIDVVEEYNLQEMKDEEIDLLIGVMDSIIDSYYDFLEKLQDMKAAEDAAVLTPIPLTLVNRTGFALTSLSLYEEGAASAPVNILENLPPLAPGQVMTGMVIQRDAQNTPWIISIKDEAGKLMEVSLPVAEYTKEGLTLSLSFSKESGLLTAEREEKAQDETAGEKNAQGEEKVQAEAREPSV